MIHWTVPSSTPAIAPGQLHPPHDVRRAGAAHVLEMDGALHMVYWGTDTDGRNAIFGAVADPNAPTTWRPAGGPLIGPQPETAHNSTGPGFPFLLRVTDSRWLLYFCGWGRKRADGKLPNTTGVAVSDDAGATWRYHDTHPVVPLDRPHNREGTGSVWVLPEGDRFRMYYTAIARYAPKPEGTTTGHGDVIPHIGIAYAESDDGLTWTTPADDWIVSPRGFGVEPYEYICSKPCVVREPHGYTMWVNTFGTAYRVHRLTSDDGLNWRWAPRMGPEGELGVGLPGAFDATQRSYPTVLPHGDGYRCWFTGDRFGATGIGYAEGRNSD